MGVSGHVGETLDDKYRIERELGRGGMGTVYLATHLGTERPVAVKIISPQYMQRAEFVERFRREARAAGRLRHPNVVDVTDFGFSDTEKGRVAYLVMEYLDGCTLGEILEEEGSLPVGWTLDILEQVCSAVHEAHTQGIIHRDLKPDNIWLEPNQRGGYTVKVLDFGIAKLEEQMSDADHESVLAGSGDSLSRRTLADPGASPTMVGSRPNTLFGEASTMALPPESSTLVSEAGTSIQNEKQSEAKTALFADLPTITGDLDTNGTRLVSGSDVDGSGPHTPEIAGRTSSDLTRVGAVLGTPLYMSPEQCRGEKLDSRSDIYSLGIIAYQMLSGSTPFSGDFTTVMEAHRLVEPDPVRAKKARRKMRRAIHRALAKDPEKRPATAEAFASELRSRSEGLLALLRRSLVIYSEHLPKFLILTTFFSLPIIILTLALVTFAFLRISGIIGETAATVASGILGLSLSIVSVFCSYLNVGTITWIVTQYLAVPLRPVRVRPALREARKKWKTFAGTGMLNTLTIFVVGIVACLCGFAVGLLLSLLGVPFFGWTSSQFIFAGVVGGIIGFVGFITAHVIWTLVSPVVMMENRRGRTAMRRSKDLVMRSVWTSAGAAFIMFLIPAILAGSISLFINIAAKAYDPKLSTPVLKVGKIEETSPERTAQSGQPENSSERQAAELKEKTTTFGINWGNDTDVKVEESDKDMQSRVKHTILESLVQVVWLPMQILVVSFSGIIIALLYLKTRLSGGETMNELMERFEDDDRPRKKWQERVRQRLIQSGRVTSKP
jgi:serine/threonine protein kinase